MNIASIQKRKLSFSKLFLLCLLVSLSIFLSFNLFFVKKEKIITNITVTNKVLVSEGGENTYYRFSKRGGTYATTIKYPPVYKIYAISEEDGKIEFYATDYNSFSFNSKYYVEYKKTTLLKKTKIEDVKKIL